MIVVGGWPGRQVIGLNGRFGVRQSELASGGAEPSPFLNNFDAGDDAATEMVVVVTSLPGSGTVTLTDDGDFTHTGGADGTYTTLGTVYSWAPGGPLIQHVAPESITSSFGAATTSVTRAQAGTYAVLQPVAKARSGAYAVRAEVRRSQASSYQVEATGTVSRSQPGAYNITVSVQAYRAGAYAVHRAVAASRAGTYAVLAQVRRSQAGSYLVGGVRVLASSAASTGGLSTARRPAQVSTGARRFQQ